MKIDVNGTTLFFEKSGGGTPLILLHGNGQDHSIFDKLAAKLEAHFTIYALDSRRHGQSAKAEGDLSYGEMAEDVYAFIEALSLGRVNIVGFSDGAIITLLLAMKHSECVEKMVLLGVNLKPEDFTERSYQFIKETYEKTGDPLFKLMLEQPDIELADVAKVNIPTLLIAAEKEICKAETFPRLAAAMPDASLKIMAGHKHETYIVHQDILYPDLLAFFTGE